jgi:drug/metabolite transporter (DMT)-like permease
LVAPSAWGFLGVGAMGTVLVQSAFQIADLPAAVTALTATEPLAGALIGVVVFGERLASGPLVAPAVAGAAIAMVATSALVARSPLLESAHAEATAPHGPSPALVG